MKIGINAKGLIDIENISHFEFEMILLAVQNFENDYVFSTIKEKSVLRRTAFNMKVFAVKNKVEIVTTKIEEWKIW